jgi:hypothetical protein
MQERELQAAGVPLADLPDMLLMAFNMLIIITIPCKPYLSASATAPHPLGRRKVERLFSLFSV